MKGFGKPDAGVPRAIFEGYEEYGDTHVKECRSKTREGGEKKRVYGQGLICRLRHRLKCLLFASDPSSADCFRREGRRNPEITSTAERMLLYYMSLGMAFCNAHLSALSR